MFLPLSYRFMDGIQVVPAASHLLYYAFFFLIIAEFASFPSSWDSESSRSERRLLIIDERRALAGGSQP